ncbi:hypothetical protein DY000_02018721 [Brassica cretica]|uniref:Peptidase C1A papain C-terminal domain-containing protein n=1 Tax=Brassica cretica TaxID=69181 RepID=A0ABQ7CQS7_BRACR|nr:hypothetical protein DY000_02018721 [Brassica cretica]
MGPMKVAKVLNIIELRSFPIPTNLINTQGYNSGGPISAWRYVKLQYLFHMTTHYKSGVYKHISGTNIGGHSVKLIDWKTSDDGEDYWCAVDSKLATIEYRLQFV